MSISVNFTTDASRVRKEIAGMTDQLAKAGTVASSATKNLSKLGNVNAPKIDVNSSIANSVSSINTQFKNLNTTASQTYKLFARIAAISFAGIAVFKLQNAISSVGDSLTSVENRIKVVTKQTEDFLAVRNQLYEISTVTQMGIESTVEAYNRLSLALNKKLDQSSIMDATTAIQLAAKISGGSAESLNAAVIQLSQGISGNFKAAGAEINSVLEQAPRIAIAIADGLGITVDQIRVMAAEGQLTGEAVTKALISQIPTLEAEFQRMSKTAGGSFATMVDNLKLFVGEIDKYFGFSAAKSRYYQAFSRFFLNAGKDISKDLDTIIPLIKKKLEPLTNLLSTVFSKIIVPAASFGWSIASSMYSNLVEPALSAFNRLINGLIGMAQGLWGRIKAPFMEVYNNLVALFYALGDAIVFGSPWPDMLDAIVDLAYTLWPRLKAAFMAFYDGVYGMFTSLKDTVVNSFSKVYKALTNIFSDKRIYSGLETLRDNLLNFRLSDWLSSISSNFGEMFNKLRAKIREKAIPIMEFFSVDWGTLVAVLLSGLFAIYNLVFRGYFVFGLKLAGALVAGMVTSLDSVRYTIAKVLQGFIKTTSKALGFDLKTATNDAISNSLKSTKLDVNVIDDSTIVKVSKSIANLFTAIAVTILGVVGATLSDILPDTLKRILVGSTGESVGTDIGENIADGVKTALSKGVETAVTSSIDNFPEAIASKYGSQLGAMLMIGAAAAMSPAFRGLLMMPLRFLFSGAGDSQLSVSEIYQFYQRNARRVISVIAGFSIANLITEQLGMDQSSVFTIMTEYGLALGTGMLTDLVYGLTLSQAGAPSLVGRLLSRSMIGIVLGSILGTEFGKVILEFLPEGIQKGVNEVLSKTKSFFTYLYDSLLKALEGQEKPTQLLTSIASLASSYQSIFLPVGLTLGYVIASSILSSLFRGLSTAVSNSFAASRNRIQVVINNATANAASSNRGRWLAYGKIAGRGLMMSLGGVLAFGIAQGLTDSATGEAPSMLEQGVLIAAGLAVSSLIESVLSGALSKVSTSYIAAGGASGIFKSAANKLSASIMRRFSALMAARVIFHAGSALTISLAGLGIILVGIITRALMGDSFSDIAIEPITGLGLSLGELIGIALGLAVASGFGAGLAKLAWSNIIKGFLVNTIRTVGFRNVGIIAAYIIGDSVIKGLKPNSSFGTELVREFADWMGMSLGKGGGFEESLSMMFSDLAGNQVDVPSNIVDKFWGSIFENLLLTAGLSKVLPTSYGPVIGFFSFAIMDMMKALNLYERMGLGFLEGREDLVKYLAAAALMVRKSLFSSFLAPLVSAFVALNARIVNLSLGGGMMAAINQSMMAGLRNKLVFTALGTMIMGGVLNGILTAITGEGAFERVLGDTIAAKMLDSLSGISAGASVGYLKGGLKGAFIGAVVGGLGQAFLSSPAWDGVGSDFAEAMKKAIEDPDVSLTEAAMDTIANNVINSISGAFTAARFAKSQSSFSAKLKLALVGGLFANLGTIVAEAVDEGLTDSGVTDGNIFSGAISGALNAGMTAGMVSKNPYVAIAAAIAGGIGGALMESPATMKAATDFMSYLGSEMEKAAKGEEGAKWWAKTGVAIGEGLSDSLDMTVGFIRKIMGDPSAWSGLSSDNMWVRLSGWIDGLVAKLSLVLRDLSNPFESNDSRLKWAKQAEADLTMKIEAERAKGDQGSPFEIAGFEAKLAVARAEITRLEALINQNVAQQVSKDREMNQRQRDFLVATGVDPNSDAIKTLDATIATQTAMLTPELAKLSEVLAGLETARAASETGFTNGDAEAVMEADKTINELNSLKAGLLTTLGLTEDEAVQQLSNVKTLSDSVNQAATAVSPLAGAIQGVSGSVSSVSSALDVLSSKIRNYSLPAPQQSVPSTMVPLKRASGGYISGPGTGTSDSIPAMLSNGEFVINAESTRKFGPVLKAINDGTYGRFAGGFTGGSGATPATAYVPYNGDMSLAVTDHLTTLWNDLTEGMSESLGFTSETAKEASTSINNSSSSTKKLTEAQTEATKAEKERTDALKDITKQLRESFVVDEVTMSQAGLDGAQAMASSMKENLTGLLTGELSPKEALLGFLDSLTNQIISTFVDSFVNSLFSEDGLNLGGLFSNMFSGISGVGKTAGTQLATGFGQGAADTATSVVTPTLFGDGGALTSIFKGISGLFKNIFGFITSIFGGFGGGGVGAAKLATGGYISGPGTGTSDSIPAMLSNGEYVINAASTKKFMPLLEAINSGEKLPVFAAGGSVGPANKKAFSAVTANRRDGNQTRFEINVTGDVSRQTKSEILKMIPQIASGVNMTNKERGSR